MEGWQKNLLHKVALHICRSGGSVPYYSLAPVTWVRVAGQRELPNRRTKWRDKNDSSLFPPFHSTQRCFIMVLPRTSNVINWRTERERERGSKKCLLHRRPSVRLDFAAVSGRGRRCCLRLLIVPRVNYSSGSSRSLDGQKRIIIIMNNAVLARSLAR